MIPMASAIRRKRVNADRVKLIQRPYLSILERAQLLSHPSLAHFSANEPPSQILGDHFSQKSLIALSNFLSTRMPFVGGASLPTMANPSDQ
jgi:hypothetical protein